MVAVKCAPLNDHSAREDDHRRDESREKLACDKHLAAYRREQVIVQALVEHLAAKQVHEDAHASEKDGDAKIKKLENAGEDLRVLSEVFAHTVRGSEQPVQEHRHRGGEGEKVNP